MNRSGGWIRELMSGFGLGLLFGIALHRSGVTNPDVIFEQLLLRDMTVVKVMMSAVVVGGLGIYVMHRLGMVQLHIREAAVGSTVIGGLIFGVGFALLGYCPGTAVAAVGEGRLDALFGGIIGMLSGAFIYAMVYPRAKPLLAIRSMGKKTLWQLVGLPPLATMALVSAAIILMFWWFESAGL
jgi:uncharacterized membrane protein YedE/YeeE